MIQNAENYDEQWNRLHDFIKYNPGARHRRRLLSKHLKELSLSSPTVIDAGCGLGFNVQAISNAIPDARITGIDFSSVAIEGAAAKFPNNNWRIVDLNHPPSGLTAEIVICTEVIEHVENWELLLSNLDCLVEGNGYLFLTTQSGKVHRTEQMVGHVRHFQISDLTNFLKSAGYEIVRAKTWGWPGYVLLKYLGNVNADRTMATLGSGRYGKFARFANYFAYVLSGTLSRSNSSYGSQIVIVARKL